MSLIKLVIASALALAAQAQAQATLVTSATLVIVPAFGEVTHPNDLATALFMVEEQDKDKAIAASRVNQKMKQGTDIVRRQDPQAVLKTQGYYTYPVYPERRPLPDGSVPKAVPTGWRVGQYLEVKTPNLAALAATAAAAQKILALNSLNFGLTPATVKKLDGQRIAATYLNLNERVAAIAAAMGRKVSDAVLDTVDFEGSGNYAGPRSDIAAAPQMMMRSSSMASLEVAEPSFEPGETTLQMHLVGKVRFK